MNPNRTSIGREGLMLLVVVGALGCSVDEATVRKGGVDDGGAAGASGASTSTSGGRASSDGSSRTHVGGASAVNGGNGADEGSAASGHAGASEVQAGSQNGSSTGGTLGSADPDDAVGGSDGGESGASGGTADVATGGAREGSVTGGASGLSDNAGAGGGGAPSSSGGTPGGSGSTPGGSSGTPGGSGGTPDGSGGAPSGSGGTPDGSGGTPPFEPECTGNEDCAPSEYCNVDRCDPDVCASLSTRCEANGIQTCSADGDAWSTPATCLGGTTCVDFDGEAACIEGCTPSDEICVGAVPMICNEQGIDYEPLGPACTGSTSCSGGECQPWICQPDAYLCESGLRYLCDTDGLGMRPVACGAEEYCSEGTCHARICEPDAPACNNQIATTCNADGSGYRAGGTECTGATSCHEGACDPMICDPDAYYCDAGQRYHCSADGLAAALASCSSETYCDAATGQCLDQLCTPNTATCDGEVATTCNADGSGYTGDRTDCDASGGACDDGACTVCRSGSFFCQGLALRQCDGTGNSSTVYKQCLASEFCDSTALDCFPQICTPDNPACDANVATTCNADGSGYTGDRTDCGGGFGCSAGGCLPAVVDEVGVEPDAGTPNSGSELALTNQFVVTSTRHLKSFEQYLQVTDSTEATCVVYGGSSPYGSNPLVASLPITVSPTDVRQSCVFDVPVELTSGQYYHIGLYWGDTSATWHLGGTTTVVEFGTASGSRSTPALTGAPPSAVSTGAASSQLYQQRITTIP